MDWARHLRRVFFHLGEDASFTHGTAAAVEVSGIYLAPYAVLPAGLESGFESSVPRFAAMTEDLPSVAQGDVITRGTNDFEIVAVEPNDPGGYTVLQLQESAAP